jgi:hypothetical protein
MEGTSPEQQLAGARDQQDQHKNPDQKTAENLLAL